MSASLRLRITDYQNPNDFRWQLEGPNGNVLADKNVHLDTAQIEYQGYNDLPAYLKAYRAVHTEAELLATAGDWIGEHVFGNILPAIIENETSPLTTVAVLAPQTAQALLERPLELARLNGQSLTEQNIRLIYERENAAAPKAKASGNPLRILAVFSLPDAESPLNLRQERYELEKFVRGLEGLGKAVELRILQYGATRDTLKDALADGDGWDILHFSGHGKQGVLVLEKPDGAADSITAAELQTILRPTKGRVSLTFLSACLSGATTLQEARRALGLDPLRRDDKSDAETDAPAAQKTVFPSLGQQLAEQLDTAVVAMRYAVGDRFASDLANALYVALLTKAQTLPRALHTALDTACTPAVAAALPLSPLTPILFGSRAADLKLALAERPYDFVLPRVGNDAFPPEPERFVGRLQPMRLGQETLAPAGEKRGILYYGMAGAGKTTIATELSHRYDEARFRGFVWFDCPKQDSDIGGVFAAFLNALYNQLELTDTALLENADRPDEFNRTTLPRLRQYLRQSACLIVLDNLEGLLKPNHDWREPAWGPLMNALLDTQSQSRVVLTSRHIPVSLAALPQLERCSVHALSLGEAYLIARELPHLKGLFDDAAGLSLLQWTLRLVQGHPKLLEFADGIAADRAALQAQLTSAELAAEGSATLQAFFDTGETTRQEPQFLQAFSFWTRSLEDQLSPPARLLFAFLACVEEEDRTSDILSQTWPVFLEQTPESLPGRAEARANPAQSLNAGLRELTGPGLIEAQSLPLPDDAPADTPPTFRYALHPAVAETARQSIDPALRVAADQTLSGLWYTYAQYFLEHETEGHTSSLIAAAKRALPYLVRQQEWGAVATLAEHIAYRDQSPATLALVLPLLERATEAETEAGGDGNTAGVLAKTLAKMGRTDEAEQRLGVLIEQAEGHDDYQTASIRAGDLTNLLMSTGRYEEALASAEREIAYARQVGAGPWTQLLKEAGRLQIRNAMGQWQATLDEGDALLKRMEGLSETVAAGHYEGAPPYHVREFLLDTLCEAAVYTAQDVLALKHNAAIVQSLVKRNADVLEIASKRFNDYSPLLRLNRYAEARELLQACREVFADAGNDTNLGNVYSALARLENELGHLVEAAAFERQALLHRYRATQPNDCAISHNNLATYHKRLNQWEEAQAHRLADAIISLQIRAGLLQTSVRNLARSDVSGAPPSFDWVADIVEQVPGVRFRELFARLPQTVPDGDAAIAAVWEMARQVQAQRASPQAVVADLPPAVLAALEAQSMEALREALTQLPVEQMQAVVRSLTEAGIIGTGA